MDWYISPFQSYGENRLEVTNPPQWPGDTYAQSSELYARNLDEGLMPDCFARGLTKAYTKPSAPIFSKKTYRENLDKVRETILGCGSSKCHPLCHYILPLLIQSRKRHQRPGYNSIEGFNLRFVIRGGEETAYNQNPIRLLLSLGHKLVSDSLRVGLLLFLVWKGTKKVLDLWGKFGEGVLHNKINVD